MIRPIQPNFASGEISPDLYSRTDIDRYRSGLRTLRNFIVHPTGGASNRPGTILVASCKYSTLNSTVQEFVFNENQRYVLEIGHHYIRFYTSQAQVQATATDYAIWSGSTAYVAGDFVTLAGPILYYALLDSTNKNPATQTSYWSQQTIYEVYTPYGEDDLPDLRFETSADTIFITHPDYQTRTLTREGNTDWELELYEPDDGPFMPENADESISMNATGWGGTNATILNTLGSSSTGVTETVSGLVTLNSASAYFDADMVGGFFKLRNYVEAGAARTAISSATFTSSVKCFRTWRLVTTGTWTGTAYLQKSTDFGVTWTNIRGFKSVNDNNADTSGTESIDINPRPFLVRFYVDSYTSGTVNVSLTTDDFYQEGIIELVTFNSTTQMYGRIVQPTLGYVQTPSTYNTTSWSEGSWSNHRGWPRVARFFQDRLVFAATTGEPDTFWMTETGNYYSFFIHDTTLDSDAIISRLPSRQVNVINGLVAFKRLLVLTDPSIWSVGPVSGAAMTPTTFTTEIEEYTGSSGLNPVVIGNEAIYIQQHGKIVSNLGFSIDSEGFQGSDMNILSSHLFNRWTITDMAYQRDPHRVVWMLRDDGILLGMTYLKEQEVVAFHQHYTSENTSDDIKSICVVPASGYDELWWTVERERGWYIERMARRMTPVTCGLSQEFSPYNQIFMDSTVSLDNALAIQTLTSTSTVTVGTTTAHGFSNGNTVQIDCAGGFNGKYTISGVTTYTFTLDSLNGASISTYEPTGYVRKCFSTVSGVSHLIGYSVSILADGQALTAQTVSGDTITLPASYAQIHIGIPYHSDLETLNVELGLANGTTHGNKVKIGQVMFRLLNTRGGYIGPDEDHLQGAEAFTTLNLTSKDATTVYPYIGDDDDEVPDSLAPATTEKLYSVDIKKVLGAEYRSGGRVFYQQTKPLPVTITAIVPDIMPANMSISKL